MKTASRSCVQTICLLVGLSVPVDLRGDVIEVIDGDFGPHWTSAHITGGSGTSAFGSAVNLSVGGLPDAYRRSEHVHGGSVPNDVLSWFFNFNSAQVYSPASQGPLNQVSVLFDGIIFASSNDGAAQFGPAVRQQGRIYYFDPMAAGQSHTSVGWRRFDFGPLVEDDFQAAPNVFGPSLDFAMGGPIEFGYWSLVGDFFTASAETGVDNWQVRLQVQPIPEPSSGTLVFLGWCYGLSVGRRSRHR